MRGLFVESGSSDLEFRRYPAVSMGKITRRASFLGAACAVVVFASSCGDSSHEDAPLLDSARDGGNDARAESSGPRDATVDERWFEEVAQASGIDLVRGEAQFDDIEGRFAGGVCVLDFDRDGALDLLFAAPLSAGGMRLYRAASPSSTGTGTGPSKMTFSDVTGARGLDSVDAGGCLVFDLEGDGDADIVALGVGQVRLLRNDGGSFVDVSDRLPKAFDSASQYTSAVAFDADGDSLLDLAIGDYGAYRAPPPEFDCVVTCALNNGLFHGGSTVLLLQRAGGTFEDVSDRLGRVDESGMVLLATDLDEDGQLDLFVGNDSPTTLDRYFVSRPGGAFVDVASKLGVAFNARKNGVSSMSAFDADVDLDGHLDLLESSWDDDRDSLFRCSAGSCLDIAEDVELFRTPKNLRWGQTLADFDDDSVLELLEAVGHIYRDSDLLAPPDAGPPRFGPVSAPPLLWHRPSVDAPFAIAAATDGLSVSTAGRGVVAVDLDADGALDAVVGTALGRPLLLRGVHGPRGHWIGVALVGRGGNSRGVGARVEVTVGAAHFVSVIHAGFGFRSSVDAPLHVGIGDASVIDSIDVTWPSGKHSRTTGVLADRVTTIDEP